MAKWAIGVASLFDNDLKVEIIEAYEPLGALKKHSLTGNYESPDGSPTDEEIKEFFFSMDMLVDWERLD